MTYAHNSETSVDFVIPAHNEAETVGAVVEECRETLGRIAVAGEVFVVADHCRDNTVEAASMAGATVIELTGGVGSKADAVRAGVESATREYIYLVDADCLGLTSDHLSRIAAPVLKGETQMSVGVFDYRIVDRLVHRYPWSSGERIIHRDSFDWSDRRLSGYNLEVLINESIGRQGGRTASFIMDGVHQRSKVQKLGRLAGIRGDVEMWRNICNSLDEIDLESYRRYMRNVRMYSAQGEPHEPSPLLADAGFSVLRLARKALTASFT